MKLKHVIFCIFITVICLTSQIYGQKRFEKPGIRQYISQPLIEVTESETIPRHNLRVEHGDDLRELVRGNNQFAIEFYGHVKNMSENIFFSPYSISSALGMTFAGARGSTEREIAKALHFNINQKLTHQSFYKLQKYFDDIQADGQVKLGVANSLWFQENTDVLQSYLDLTSKYYSGAIKLVDFNNNAENVRQTINQWVESKTNNKIKDLLQSGDINSYTKLVLCNAIYFKGDWLLKFKELNTKDRNFTLPEGKVVKCPTMNKVGHYKCKQFDEFSAISIPYKGRKLSMVIFLPNNSNELSSFEESFTPEQTQGWLNDIERLRTIKVDLRIPKFKMTRKLKLTQILKKMGIQRVFGNADLSGISETTELQVSDVIHKAFVELDEEGTEAAAATAVFVGKTSSAPIREAEPVKFYADHPFVFMIKENSTGSILFVGRVINPL